MQRLKLALQCHRKWAKQTIWEEIPPKYVLNWTEQSRVRLQNVFSRRASVSEQIECQHSLPSALVALNSKLTQCQRIIYSMLSWIIKLKVKWIIKSVPHQNKRTNLDLKKKKKKKEGATLAECPPLCHFNQMKWNGHTFPFWSVEMRKEVQFRHVYCEIQRGRGEKAAAYQPAPDSQRLSYPSWKYTRLPVTRPRPWSSGHRTAAWAERGQHICLLRYKACFCFLKKKHGENQSTDIRGL